MSADKQLLLRSKTDQKNARNAQRVLHVTNGQQRWSHFAKVKAGSLSMLRSGQQGDVTTINEGEEHDHFDEEYNFSAGQEPNRMSRAAHTDDDCTVNPDAADDSIYEASPPSFSTPPVERSVDLLPSMYSSNQPSNVLTDEVSIYSEVTEHSMATIPIANRRLGRDDVTVMTTSTMVTAPVGNTVSQRDHHANLLGSSGTPSRRNSTSGNTDTPEQRHPSALGRTSGRHPPSSMGRAMINAQGHTMSEQEMQVLWEAAGKCTQCGAVSTHAKEKYGPFRTLRRMVPLTVEGLSYKGYCLRCHDVPQLRRLLHEPDIPLDLRRDDPNNASLRSLQETSGGAGGIDVADFVGRKSSPLEAMFASLRFQIFCGAILLIIAGSIVAVSIALTKKADPWVSKAPTTAPSVSPSTAVPSSSPTFWEWSVTSEIVSDDTSFGYHIELDSDGIILAVASPVANGGKGMFHVYAMEYVLEEQKWIKLDFVPDAVQTGFTSLDHMSQGMSLSGDGRTVAVGAPGNGLGWVQVYQLDTSTLKISMKGQRLFGPSNSSEFGHAVTLNRNGTMLFVGAPNHFPYGLVQAYEYDSGTNSWIQTGEDMFGETIDCRFGHTIACDDAGEFVIVGAPLDSSKWDNGGELFFYQRQGGVEWEKYEKTQVNGAMDDSRMGLRLACNEDGTVVITNNHDRDYEEFENAGTMEVWGVDTENLQVNMIGVPISGAQVNEGFGYDMDVASNGEIMIVSGKNEGKTTGTVKVFLYNVGGYLPYGDQQTGLEMGTCDPFGGGPSVTVAATKFRMAVGYECLMRISGKSRSVVQVFDYFSQALGDTESNSESD